MGAKNILKQYLLNATFHGAKFIVDEQYHMFERIFWGCCILASWYGAAQLVRSSFDAYNTSAISFVVETSYKDWKTQFPAIVVCEAKNMDRVQLVAEQLWGAEHDFTLEEVLSEMAYFRGESYHAVHECGSEDSDVNCFLSNFSYYASLVRSSCEETLDNCSWNGKKFDCCKFFQRIDTELGICYALNSVQSKRGARLNMLSDKYSGPGTLKIDVFSEAFVYTFGAEDVPNLVTPKSDVLQIDHFLYYKRKILIKNIENDPDTREVSISQRNCRFRDENILDVHRYYSYSACSVQCRKREQLRICNCTSHLMPGTPPSKHCDMNGLVCLNEHYEELSVVIAKWSYGRKGVVCDCLPSCTEVDISVVHDNREMLYDYDKTFSTVEISLAALPSERYKRNVVRGKLDLVVSVGGSGGLFVGASLLTFIELLYYFTLRPCGDTDDVKEPESPDDID
uniref:CSON004271 protein n=1 Tax=Culicoides sonorensis TaxID=179676 RepID=A0A336MNG8_CULSO